MPFLSRQQRKDSTLTPEQFREEVGATPHPQPADGARQVGETWSLEKYHANQKPAAKGKGKVASKRKPKIIPPATLPVPGDFTPGQVQRIMGICPSKSNGYRIATINGHASLVKTKALTDYEEKFYMQCNLYRDANIQDYFEFHMDVFYPVERFDVDGSLKVTLDCLQKINAFRNDSRCTKLVIRKFLDTQNPRIEFSIHPVIL